MFYQKLSQNTFSLKDAEIQKSLKYLMQFNDFALIIIKDQKTLKQKMLKNIIIL